MRLGSHVSIRRGFLEAAKMAKSIGADAFQYFPKNPRGLSVKTFDRRDAAKCAAFCREHHLVSIAHAPYPTNLAVEAEDKREWMKQSILNDLEIAEACGSLGVVVHFGDYKGKDLLQGYKNILQLVNEVIAEWNGNALLLLENQAGEGGALGTRLEELAQIRNLAAEPEKIAFCFDTCHAYASGLWRDGKWSEMFRCGEQLGYFEHVKAVHLNDSAYPSGSAKDRHANIGCGRIGETNWRDFLRSPFLQDAAVILETPAAAGHTHAQEISMVRGMAVAERAAGMGESAADMGERSGQDEL